MGQDRKSAERRSFNLYEYIGDVFMSLRPRLRMTGYKIVIDCPEDLIIESYPGEISQILTNFIMNTLMHAFADNDNGTITVYARKEGSSIVMKYSDDGIGIPDENISKIFNPFFTTKRGSGGSGLGLNIVYNIVTETLGGTIECVSKPGQGAEFTIVFSEISAEK